MLATENKRRDVNRHDDTYDEVYVTHVNADGTTEERKVDKVLVSRSFCSRVWLIYLPSQAFLDLTDIQNKDFRYLL